IQSAPSWLTGTADGPDDLEDSLVALRMDFGHELNGDHLKSVDFGARFSTRSKDYLHRHQDYVSQVAGNLPADLFSNYNVTEFDAPPLLNGSFPQLADLVYGGMPVDRNAIVQANTWGVDEDVGEGYVKFRFAGSVGSLPFAGNAGVRVVSTTTSSTGFGSTNGG